MKIEFNEFQKIAGWLRSIGASELTLLAGNPADKDVRGIIRLMNSSKTYEVTVRWRWDESRDRGFFSVRGDDNFEIYLLKMAQQ